MLNIISYKHVFYSFIIRLTFNSNNKNLDSNMTILFSFFEIKLKFFFSKILENLLYL